MYILIRTGVEMNGGRNATPISKSRAVLIVMILSEIIGVGSVLSLLRVYYTIPSSGLINPPVTSPLVSYESEIRAVFLHMTSLSQQNDWSLIAQTLHKYNVSVVVVEMMSPRYAAYSSNVIQRSTSAIDVNKALSALHPLGIEFYVAMDVLYLTPEPEYMSVAADGTAIDWLCPVKEISRNYLKAIVEELVTQYPDIDGFMFDYLRWDLRLDMGYCDECKASLEMWLGETINAWPGDFAPGGSRHKEFLEWRVTPITQLLVDMISWMKAIKSDLKIAAAPWTIYPPGGLAERNKWLGQDWTDWVAKGYLDWVAPMIYVYPHELETIFRPSVQGNIKYGLGGPEGKIPLIIFVANQFPVVKTPEELKAEVDIIREEGADGWIIWRYGGPGVGETDIEPYLQVLDTFDVFSISDISVMSTNDSAVIAWKTNLPATSRVEYSTSPLFNASRNYDPLNNFDYWDIDHVEGTIVEDAMLVTSHSVTLTGLHEGVLYYYRVQSADQYGVATSRVYELKIGM